MPSENKTPNIGLNQWQGNEYPKREDFNEDNLIIDTKIKNIEDNKVDKDGTKGLSDENYTTEEKEKLGGIADGATKVEDSATNGNIKINGAETNVYTHPGSGTNPHGTTKSDVGLGAVDNAKQATKTEFDSHVANKIQHIPYATASGTNTYTVSIPGISSLAEGLSIKVKFTNANTGAATLNVNSLGAKSIVKSNGNVLSSGNIKAGQICHLVYTGSNFQLLGEGGEYGTAQAGDVLSGKTIGTESGIITGTMPNRGTINNTITTQNGQIAVPQGYHNGSGVVKAQFANLVAENVKSGINIGGVVGSFLGSIYAVPSSNDRVTILQSTSSGNTTKTYRFKTHASGGMQATLKVTATSSVSGSSFDLTFRKNSIELLKIHWVYGDGETELQDTFNIYADDICEIEIKTSYTGGSMVSGEITLSYDLNKVPYAYTNAS